jgi:hypothetical protein
VTCRPGKEANVTVCAAFAIANVRCTAGAAFQPALPAWVAVISHVPAPVIDTAAPATEHCPTAANVTVSPEVAVAAMANAGSPKVLSPGGANVIVCSLFAMVNVRATFGAAFQFASPAWLAVIVHDPTVDRVTVDPEIEHCPVAVNVTGSPELVLAETVKGGSAGFLSLSVPKVMLWSPLAIEKVRGTAPAAAQTPSPDWFAVIVHVPAPVIVTLEPATVHFPLAVNATGCTGQGRFHRFNIEICL